jgi:hypothetical protein
MAILILLTFTAVIGRYRSMAEQHHKDTKALKKAEEVSDSGYKFDSDLCRKIFDEFDRDGSGYLDIGEMSKLSEVANLHCTRCT